MYTMLLQVGGYKPSTVIDFEIPKNMVFEADCRHNWDRRDF